MKNKMSVSRAVLAAAKGSPLLFLSLAAAIIASALAGLLPPLVLGRAVDSLSTNAGLPLRLALGYFLSLALAGALDAGREVLITVSGQRMTHVLRGEMCRKLSRLPSGYLAGADPGQLTSLFTGDVDAMEALFASGVVSMFADACKLVGILTVIWFRNRGLTVVLLALLPFLFVFTRHVQKNMLAAQIENRKAVGRASGHVPETLHNIRTIHCLNKEAYMEQRYDAYIGKSYQAMEKTNFYDAIYSPVILILNAVVVAAVMLLSASGNPRVLTFFGMSAGTAVAVINYIAQIFVPVERLGMEIQTIQSAVAGIHRIDEFFALE